MKIIQFVRYEQRSHATETRARYINTVSSPLWCFTTRCFADVCHWPCFFFPPMRRLSSRARTHGFSLTWQPTRRRPFSVATTAFVQCIFDDFYHRQYLWLVHLLQSQRTHFRWGDKTLTKYDDDKRTTGETKPRNASKLCESLINILYGFMGSSGLLFVFRCTAFSVYSLSQNVKLNWARTVDSQPSMWFCVHGHLFRADVIQTTEYTEIIIRISEASIWLRLGEAASAQCQARAIVWNNKGNEHRVMWGRGMTVTWFCINFITRSLCKHTHKHTAALTHNNAKW